MPGGRPRASTVRVLAPTSPAGRATPMGLAGDGPGADPDGMAETRPPQPKRRRRRPPPGTVAMRVIVNGRTVWEPGVSREEEVRRTHEALGLPPER
jgi:hypothetical protein